MTKLIHPYSLQAFPTEKILKEFKPVRGCHVRGKIELPPGQAELLFASLRNRDSDPLAWQKPTVEVDLRPLFDAIAERMGYDPALLAEGRGETGRADHAWSTYADESGFPLLVRWQAGQGELLLSIGIFGREELSVAMLADEAGLETMLKVHDVVTGIEATRGRTERVSVPVGDTMQIVEVASRSAWSYFGPCVTVCLPPDRQLNELRRKDLERIFGGVLLLVGTEEEVNERHGGIAGFPQLKANALRLVSIPASTARLDFGPTEPLSESLVELINEAGVRRAWRAFESTADERAAALALPHALRRAAEDIRAGSDVGQALAHAEADILTAGFAQVDYFALADAITLEELHHFDGRPARLLAAAKMGKTRLIDNLVI